MQMTQSTSSMIKRHLLAAAVLGLVTAHADAQTLTGVRVDKPSAAVGEPVQLTAEFSVRDDAINCSVRVNWGDGTQKYEKVNQSKDVPLIRSHTYATPGTYLVVVKPKSDLPTLKCQGASQTASVTVAAVTPVAAAASQANAGSACPAGWVPKKGRATSKSGAFTCVPGSHEVNWPVGRLACPGKLGYFEDARKQELGCRV